MQLAVKRFIADRDRSWDFVFDEKKAGMATRFIKIMRKNRVFNMSDLKKKVDMRVWSRSGYQRSEYFPIEAVANIGKKTALWAKEKYENYYRLNKSLDE
jgi:hypothetical protein